MGLQATAQWAEKALWFTERTCKMFQRYQQEVVIYVPPNQVNDCVHYSWAWQPDATAPSASTPSLVSLHSSLHPPEAHLTSLSCGISLPASPPLRVAPLSPNCQFVFHSIRAAWSVRRCAGGFRAAPTGSAPDQSLGNVVATSRLQQNWVNLTL